MLLDLPDALPDVVPPSAGERVTTAYQAQVRHLIAPDQLLDREEELNELVGFCAGDQPYAWWQAGPWAGKSALMAWFVLHPPAGVDVVSFFVTARLAGQSDSAEQLVKEAAEDDEHEALIAQSTTPSLRAARLSRFAETVAFDDPDRAAWLVCEAETLIAQITDPDSQAETLGRLAAAATACGDPDRADALITWITDPDSRAEALGRLADAATANGDFDRTEALITQITRPNWRARALSRLATEIARTSEKTSPVREHPHRTRPCWFGRDTFSARLLRPVHGPTSPPVWRALTHRPSALLPMSCRCAGS